MNKTLLKNLLHIFESMAFGVALYYLFSLSAYAIGGIFLSAMWLVTYFAIDLLQTPVVNKTVKNKTGIEVKSTKHQWFIGMVTSLFGYLLGGVFGCIMGGIL